MNTAKAAQTDLSRFPGLESLAAAGEPEPVLALLADGREVSGRLSGFFANTAMVEIARGGMVERLRFSDLQWLKFARPVEPVRDANAFRKTGIAVESLPARSPFTLTFTGGRVLSGELYGYGAALGGLGLYLAEETEGSIRMFVPAGAIETFAVGERLGKLLLERGQISSSGLEVALERQRMLRRQRLGSLLLERRLVNRRALEQALASQAELPVRPLGEVLVAMGVLTRAQLEMALAAQHANRRKPIGEILVELGMLDRAELHTVLAQKLGIPHVDLKRYAFDPNWADLASYPICRDHAVVPLYRSQGDVVVATADPLDINKLNVIAFALQSTVVPVLASAEDIAWALERHPERRLYDSSESSEDAVAADGSSGENAESLASQLSSEVAAGAELPLEDDARAADSTLVRLVNKIISDAYHQKASDIHIEPGNGRERLRVRFRRDGALFDYISLPARFRAAMVSRIKIMAGLDITEHRRAQDGKIDCKRFGGLPLELRVACVPTLHGLEAVALRLLAAVTPMQLSAIGLSPEDSQRLRSMVEKPCGLVIVCGPTGSGKTTTLHSLLAHLNNHDTKIWTAEDPIEITQSGLTQVQVHPAIGWTFAAALRSFLRADPDVIMIGEVRDAETAKIVVQSSLTGHLVLTTLHTNSASESVTRLVDIGVDPFNFADALLGVLAQRLTRRLCRRCARSEPATPDEMRTLAEEYCAVGGFQVETILAAWHETHATGGAVRLGRPVGCKQCSGTGYAGRLALYELLTASAAIKRITLQHGTADQIRAQGLAEGMRTLKQDGIVKVLQGLTTIEQVRAVSN